MIAERPKRETEASARGCAAAWACSGGCLGRRKDNGEPEWPLQGPGQRRPRGHGGKSLSQFREGVLALPLRSLEQQAPLRRKPRAGRLQSRHEGAGEIGRASCRERV